MAARFGIVNDPDDEDAAVLLYDGEPIGTIERRHRDGLRFIAAGLTVRDRDILLGTERSAGIGLTGSTLFTPEKYAAWKARLGIVARDA